MLVATAVVMAMNSCRVLWSGAQWRTGRALRPWPTTSCIARRGFAQLLAAASLNTGVVHWNVVWAAQLGWEQGDEGSLLVAEPLFTSKASALGPSSNSKLSRRLLVCLLAAELRQVCVCVCVCVCPFLPRCWHCPCKCLGHS